LWSKRPKMPNIYITENLYNKALGITPWRYMGSDQNDNSAYFGSSKDLEADIKRLGVEHFNKIIIESFTDITNKELRKIESMHLKANNVKKDASYYNKTDIYGAGGGVKGMKHTKKRVDSYWVNWRAARMGHDVSDETRKLQSAAKEGKTYAEIYGENAELMRKSRQQHMYGANNHNALEWEITAPDGTITRVKGLKAYCRENNLPWHSIYHSLNGWKSVKYGAGKGGAKKKEQYA